MSTTPETPLPPPPEAESPAVTADTRGLVQPDSFLVAFQPGQTVVFRDGTEYYATKVGSLVRKTLKPHRRRHR